MTDEIKMCEYKWDGDEEGGSNSWVPLDPQPSCTTCADSEECKLLDDLYWDVDIDKFFCVNWKAIE